MSLKVSSAILTATDHADLDGHRHRVLRGATAQEVRISPASLSDQGLMSLRDSAHSHQDKSLVRAIDSIMMSRQGEFSKAIPSHQAFEGILIDYLRDEALDGYIYVEGADGIERPELVTSIRYHEERDPDRQIIHSVVISTIAYGLTSRGSEREGLGVRHQKHIFYPSDVTRKTVFEALAGKGIQKETLHLQSVYHQQRERYLDQVLNGFSDQYRVSGKMYSARYYRDAGTALSGCRVIHDLPLSDCGATDLSHTAFLLGELNVENDLGSVPESLVVRVFDLKSHRFYWVSSTFMTPYQYDPGLKDKLILPSTHHDLLEVLTTDLDVFVGDFIEGKSAGNVILCKGTYGVGKTLTAEVYAELIERPIYSVHSGSLGITAKDIQNSLDTIFQRALRWNCVLLLDEADVFVVERGNNIEQNAIVAEFLRSMEYFSGLMFMTTNRAGDIDDAIMSRCAAIIEYKTPEKQDLAKIWRVMGVQFKTDLSDDLIDSLVRTFPKISPRDIKMLMRLAVRVNLAKGEKIDMPLFRRCAMFRAVDVVDA